MFIQGFVFVCGVEGDGFRIQIFIIVKLGLILYYYFGLLFGGYIQGYLEEMKVCFKFFLNLGYMLQFIENNRLKDRG